MLVHLRFVCLQQKNTIIQNSGWDLRLVPRRSA